MDTVPEDPAPLKGPHGNEAALAQRQSEISSLTETLHRMREREGQAAQALVSAQLELADRCTHWNEMLVARNDAATAQHGTQAALEQEAAAMAEVDALISNVRAGSNACKEMYAEQEALQQSLRMALPVQAA